MLRYLVDYDRSAHSIRRLIAAPRLAQEQGRAYVVSLVQWRVARRPPHDITEPIVL